jgi:hypothetical protein
MTTNNATNNFSSSPLTTLGDLYTFSTVNARLPIGNSGQMVIVNSTSASGLAYDFPALDVSWSYEIYHDFMSVPTTSEWVLSSTTTGTGASIVSNNTTITDGSRIGEIIMESGSTSTGLCAVSGKPFYTGNGQIIFDCPINLDQLSNSTDTFTINIGLSNSTAGVGQNNGIYFNYTNGINSGRFQCVCNLAGTSTTADSGVTVAASTWYNLQIIVNAAASSVEFYINQSLVSTITSNIPSATFISGVIILSKSVGTDNVNLRADYMRQRKDFTNQR